MGAPLAIMRKQVQPSNPTVGGARSNSGAPLTLLPTQPLSTCEWHVNCCAPIYEFAAEAGALGYWHARLPAAASHFGAMTFTTWIR